MQFDVQGQEPIDAALRPAPSLSSAKLATVPYDTCRVDLPPLFWTVLRWKIPVMKEGQEEELGMKRSNFSEAQIALALKQAEDGTSVGEVCRKTGIGAATFYAWRKKSAGFMPSEMRQQPADIADDPVNGTGPAATGRSWMTTGPVVQERIAGQRFVT